MIRALLEERFKLKVHREPREVPDLRARACTRLMASLEAGWQAFHGRLRSDCGGTRASCRPPQSRRNLASARNAAHAWGLASLTAGGQPLLELVSLLSATVGRNVIDSTGLTGRYDIHLRWTPDRVLQRAAGHDVERADSRQRRRDRSQWSVDLHGAPGAARAEARRPSAARLRHSSSITSSGRRPIRHLMSFM